MKKTTTLILIALVLATTPLLAADKRPSADLAFVAGEPSTTNNNDSCDISLQPAATLLLPYFEVDLAGNSGSVTTLFTVTNSTAIPQIAHVTIWTNLSFPVLDFNIFLTGYDVQPINLSDILVRGVIGSASGTSNSTTPGSRSGDNDDNPNFLPAAATQCSTLPGNIPAGILQDLRTGLTTGLVSTCGSSRIGTVGTLARGYITIDVAATCSTTLPSEPTYFTGEILFDNVLFGEYMHVNPGQNFAGGNPMVHIRAIPAGGPAGSIALTNLPYTFYDRYTVTSPIRTMDRRQPLPSTFGARFVQGGVFDGGTDFTIWREGVTGPNAACSSYGINSSTAMRVVDIVRFDERENPTTLATGVIISPFPTTVVVMPETSRQDVSSANFPPLDSGDVGGWMYLNLNNGGSTSYSVTSSGVSSSSFPTPRDFRSGSSTATGVRQSQNWVSVNMDAEGRFSALFDATAFGNGCTPSPVVSSASTPIAPAPRATP